MITTDAMQLMREKTANLGFKTMKLPPPVFEEMGGEITHIDLDAKVLQAQFPVVERFQNPLGFMQGGIIAAAMDNTLGPLSFLVAPPNVTAKFEIEYKKPVGPELEMIYCEATMVEKRGRLLKFAVTVKDINGNLLAKSVATHLVIKPPSSG